MSIRGVKKANESTALPPSVGIDRTVRLPDIHPNTVHALSIFADISENGHADRGAGATSPLTPRDFVEINELFVEYGATEAATDKLASLVEKYLVELTRDAINAQLVNEWLELVTKMRGDASAAFVLRFLSRHWLVTGTLSRD